jgi:hypothetical protein
LELQWSETEHVQHGQTRLLLLLLLLLVVWQLHALPLGLGSW